MKINETEILLVEDNLHDAEMTIRALRKYNVSNKITHLKDGSEALDFIFGTGEYEKRENNIQPKVILLDLKMPRVDGIEVLRRIKSDQQTKTIPVVVLTSSGEDPDVNACYDLGVSSYIIKPVGFEKFTAAIAGLGFYWLLLNHTLK